MKYIGIVLLCVAGLGVIVGGGMLLSVALFPVNTAQKEINMAYDAQDKVLTADNAIYNYEWFKQKYQDIQAGKKQLVNAQASLDSFEASAGARTSWTFEDKTEDGRLRQIVLGLQNSIQSDIGDYDARASMATRNIFANHVLPNFIDALTFIRK